MNNESDRFFSYKITDDIQEIRLDVFLSSRSFDLSRSRVQTLIKSGMVKINNCSAKPSHKLKPGDQIILSIPPPAPNILKPEEVEFQIVHEDSSIIVLNKPPGIVVHPAPGHPTGTLVHGLLQHCGNLSEIGGVLRPGIVHRLDKGTSGLMVVAKNDQAHTFLSRQFKSGMVKKRYVALVHGTVKKDKGVIDLPLSRHPKKRKEMAVALSGGKRALTQWKKIEDFNAGFSLFSVHIKTGRTHQIRVHLSHMGHPIVGDPVYGYGKNWGKRNSHIIKDLPFTIDRQMLHSENLGFIHPDSRSYMEFEASLPYDFKCILQNLRAR